MDQPRKRFIERLVTTGYIKSLNVKRAMSKVPREMFVPEKYSNQAYSDSPLPIPGGQTISAPHMHGLVLSELKLKQNDKILEVGCGSGILLVYIREIVGSKATVVGIEINKQTYNFAKHNLQKTKYKDIVLIHGDGSLGYPKFAPYDKIIVSASSPDVPKPLIEQLKINGILVLVIGPPHGEQTLIKIQKTKSGKLIEKELLPVIFVPLKGKHGWK